VTDVDNSPPSFSTTFSDQSAEVGSEWVYKFPGVTDLDENDTLETSVSVDGSSSLPTFLTFSSSGFSMTIAPTSSADIGSYAVEVTVEDDDSTGSGQTQSCSGSFTITVEVSQCLTGSYSSVALTVGETSSVAISSHNTEDCSEASYMFLQSDGSGLPSFAQTSGSSLSVAPTNNFEAGTYTIQPSITYLEDTEQLATFQI
jgi:hypothetical protein